MLAGALRCQIAAIPICDFGIFCSSQQLTYGVVSEGVFAEILRKFCGKFADNTFYCARKGCGNSAESLRKFHGNLRKIFCSDPFLNDPISVVLIIMPCKMLLSCVAIFWRFSFVKLLEISDLSLLVFIQKLKSGTS